MRFIDQKADKEHFKGVKTENEPDDIVHFARIKKEKYA